MTAGVEWTLAALARTRPDPHDSELGYGSMKDLEVSNHRSKGSQHVVFSDGKDRYIRMDAHHALDLAFVAQGEDTGVRREYE